MYLGTKGKSKELHNRMGNRKRIEYDRNAIGAVQSMLRRETRNTETGERYQQEIRIN